MEGKDKLPPLPISFWIWVPKLSRSVPSVSAPSYCLPTLNWSIAVDIYLFENPAIAKHSYENISKHDAQCTDTPKFYFLCIPLVPFGGPTPWGKYESWLSLFTKITLTQAGILTQVSKMTLAFISAIPHLLTFQLTFSRILVCIFKKKSI